MRKAAPVFLFAVLIAVFGFQVRSADAYSTYSTNGSTGNCATCHGDFTSSPYTSPGGGPSWGDSLHNVHRNTMLSGDCNTCHGSGGRSPVVLDSSVGGTGLSPISCVGCHGRNEDVTPNDGAFGAPGPGRGDGLRAHHADAGVNTCAGCHNADTVPVGENVLPPYYANPGTTHPNMPTNPCNQNGNENFAGGPDGLDNDGDGVYDGADSDCQAATAPQIDVAPASKDYGDVTVGSFSSQVFTVSNKGTADLVLTDGVLSGDPEFSLDLNGGPNPCTDPPPPIAPAGSCTGSVTFSPTSVGAFTATITVTSNDNTNSPLVIPLSGNGVTGPAPNLVVMPPSVDFGQVNVGDTPATEVTLSNTGTDNLVVSGIALDNAAVYSLDETGGANPCGSLEPTIFAGDNCTFNVIFAPDADGGPFNATVTIDSNTPSVDVPVTGTGSLDTDGDGVGDSVDDFPNDPTKATPVAATGTGKIVVDAGADALSNVAAVALAPGQTVSGFTFPDGLITFRVAVAAPGDNAVVTLTFPSGQPSGGKYFKDDGSGALVEFAGATINTDNVVLMLTDGGNGDNDNTADAMINDPGGLATPVPSSSGGGGGSCSVIGSSEGGGAVLFLTLLAILVTLRRQRAKAGR